MDVFVVNKKNSLSPSLTHVFCSCCVDSVDILFLKSQIKPRLYVLDAWMWGRGSLTCYVIGKVVTLWIVDVDGIRWLLLSCRNKHQTLTKPDLLFKLFCMVTQRRHGPFSYCILILTPLRWSPLVTNQRSIFELFAFQESIKIAFLFIAIVWLFLNNPQSKEKENPSFIVPDANHQTIYCFLRPLL